MLIVEKPKVDCHLPFASFWVLLRHDTELPPDILKQLLYNSISHSILADAAHPIFVVQVAILRVGGLGLVKDGHNKCLGEKVASAVSSKGR